MGMTVASDMRKTGILLMPRILSFLNAFRPAGKKGRSFKLVLTVSIALTVWGGIFLVSLRVLNHFKTIAELGDLLAFKLLSMVLITLFALLIFSGIITCLAKLYLSKDLHLVHSLPVPTRAIFIARWIESTVDSAWMAIVYTLPVFIAYGVVYRTGVGYYALTALNLVSLSLAASGISALLVMAAVILIPAHRLRTLFIFLGLTLFMILYIAFRLLRPERLVDPDAFATVLVYLGALKTPSPAFLPSTWAFDSLLAVLAGRTGAGVFHWSIGASFAALVGCITVLFADTAYFIGMSKAQTAPERVLAGGDPWKAPAGRFLKGPIRAFAIKEVKSFFRDTTQWSQLFLIAALFFIYLYNFKVLPLEKVPIPTFYLQNLLSFLNIALAAFVLTAITARFAYPAVGSEAEAFWIVQSAPISLTTYLWLKFFIYLLPLLVLTEAMIVTTNLMLRVTPFMMALSTLTVFLMVPGIVSLGVGLGAAYPDFRSENPAQSVTSFGGLLFMLVCAGFIGLVIVLEAKPVYHLFMAEFHHRNLHPLDWVWIGASFSGVLALCVLTVFFPIRFGERRLSERNLTV